MRHSPIVAVLLGAFLVPLACVQGSRRELPSGFKQIVPRGRLAAIDSPHFVGAREAGIPPDAWVLGIVVDAEARAYSLNLLNQHEVVNDRVGARSFAAVW